MPKKLTYDYVKDYIDNVKGYKLVSKEYKNCMTKLIIYHKDCQHIFKMSFNDFRNEHRCPSCAINKRADIYKLTYTYVKNYIDSVDGYQLISKDYKNSKTKLDIYHKKCKHTFKMSFNAFQSHGQRCPLCAIKKVADINRMSYKDVKNFIEHNEGYQLLSKEYKNAGTKLDIYHKKCHHTFQMAFSNFKSLGQRCPYCKRSHGEQFIEHYLNKHKILFEPQKTFDDLKDKKLLSYDFYLLETNILIEYQGIQHYQSSDHFGGKEQFEVQQYHDCLKRAYAKDNGITLIEIPYTKDTQRKVSLFLTKALKNS